ncbi:MAG: VanZ family protein [Chitinophagaceae bacterium]|nr:VanZ family protein [Chitinophagaceae bacterium]
MLQFKKQEYLLFALSWTHLMFYACTIPGTEVPEISFNFFIGLDKLVHLFLFTFFFLAWSFTAYYRSSLNWLLCLFGIGFGLLIEFYQFHFVDGRGFEIADVLADAIGCILGSIIRPFFQRFLLSK